MKPTTHRVEYSINIEGRVDRESSKKHLIPYAAVTRVLSGKWERALRRIGDVGLRIVCVPTPVRDCIYLSDKARAMVLFGAS